MASPVPRTLAAHAKQPRSCRRSSFDNWTIQSPIAKAHENMPDASWWAGKSREELAAQAKAEQPRMKGSKFGSVQGLLSTDG